MNLIERHHVTMRGRGQLPIVFIHGFGCDQKVWARTEPAFRDRFLTVSYDHVGAGRSDLSAYDRERYSSLHAYADDLLRLCHGLDLNDAVLVGHSVGATIAALAAAEEPERFSSLVLVASNPCFLNRGSYRGGFRRAELEALLSFLEENSEVWSRSIAPLIMGNPDRPELAQELAANFCATRPEIARHFAEVTFLSDHRRDFSAVETPSLILQCSEDKLAPADVGSYLQLRMRSSQLVTMRATGHCPHMSAPNETVEAIQSFLRETACRAARSRERAS